ncbi:uncharacterized protein BXZ73DRAFT_111936 [Epithele typhae]|uniref:uncharacterized protein n=1 Tax=Epithele typhae TaxID=378194 RepID=UPI002007A4F5|nr:uncharacterized protein BXZ73DRAFT_111936 [Epithele typhae]KAH9893893.1 hypothetical protein BXZ73DRAFT_111936 [Epithele typhae]
MSLWLSASPSALDLARFTRITIPPPPIPTSEVEQENELLQRELLADASVAGGYRPVLIDYFGGGRVPHERISAPGETQDFSTPICPSPSQPWSAL